MSMRHATSRQCSTTSTPNDVEKGTSTVWLSWWAQGNGDGEGDGDDVVVLDTQCVVVNGVSNEWREHGTRAGFTPRETGSGAVFGAGSGGSPCRESERRWSRPSRGPM